jgi:MFS family permease
MVTAHPLPAGNARARRNVWVLVVAQAILGSQMPVTFILGGLSGQLLAPNKCLATLPISVIILGSMLSAPLLANLMQRRGRSLGFVLGATGGGLGSAICALALVRGSFGLFLLGSFFTGLYMSAQGFYRFAATDGASPEFRPRAISYVMAAGLISAVVGPQIVKLTEAALDPVPFAGAYVAAALINLGGVFVFAFLDSPRPKPPAPDGPPARSRWELIRTPRIAVAMICAMVSYALMNLVMTSTPLAVVGCGFGTSQAADVVTGHVLAMFAPSFFTGHLIARFGVERVIVAGLVILAAAGAVALSGITLMHFSLALILLGAGWNFGFIGATAMLAAAHSPQEAGRVQGMNDFAVFGLVCLASLASGGLMNCSGGDAVAGWTAVNLAMVPFLTLAGAAMIWLLLQPRAPRSAN